MPACIRSFHIHRLHLYAVDGVAVYKDRVIIPTSLRADCLRFLHSAHQGTTLMQSKADACVFWPGIAADISNHRFVMPEVQHHVTIASLLATDATYPPHTAVPEPMCGLLHSQRTPLRGYSGPLLRMAHRRAIYPRRHQARIRPSLHLRYVRYSRRHHHGRRTGVHRNSHQNLPHQLGSTPPPLLCRQPTQQLSRGDRREDNQASTCWQHARERGAGLRHIPACNAHVQEHARPHNQDLPGHRGIRQTYTRPHPGPPWQTSPTPILGSSTGQQGDHHGQSRRHQTREVV